MRIEENKEKFTELKTTVSTKIVLSIDKRFNELRSEVDAKRKAVNSIFLEAVPVPKPDPIPVLVPKCMTPECEKRDDLIKFECGNCYICQDHGEK